MKISKTVGIIITEYLGLVFVAQWVMTPQGPYTSCIRAPTVTVFSIQLLVNVAGGNRMAKSMGFCHLCGSIHRNLRVQVLALLLVPRSSNCPL